MTKIHELTDEEIELVSGGRIYVARIAGFTFAHDTESRTTTVSAGGAYATHGTLPSGTTYNEVVPPGA